MSVKIGDAFIDLYIGSDGKIEWEEHVVRTIRGGKNYAIQKNISTWGKLSRKHGDFGWLPSINPMWRTSWRVCSKRPERLSATRLQAIRYAIKMHKRYEDSADYDTPKIYAQVLPRLKALEKKYSKKGKSK